MPQFPLPGIHPRLVLTAARSPRRLVLPYVRHLKGEDDKPLPPSKPRKQYKVSKGAETGEKSRRSKKEKGREQVRGPVGLGRSVAAAPSPLETLPPSRARGRSWGWGRRRAGG